MKKSEKVNFEPLHDNVVVLPLDPDEKTPGGILLPDIAREKPRRGKVIAVGPGKYNDKTGERTPVSVGVGDEVLFANYAGSEVTIGGIDYKIIAESGLLAKVVE